MKPELDTVTDWDRLVDRVLDESVELRAGENLLVTLASAGAYPLAQALAEGAVRRGANHHALLHTEDVDEAIRRFGSDDVSLGQRFHEWPSSSA